MKKNILIFILFFLFKTVSSQAFEKKFIEFNSLEGLPVKITVELDYVRGKFTISLNSLENICIEGFTGLTKRIDVIDNKFASFYYGIRSGSGTKTERFLLLCVSGGHFIKSLDLVSSQSYQFKKTYDKEVDSLNVYDEKGVYKLDFVFAKNRRECNYRLISTEYDFVKSKSEPNTNSESKRTLEFNFDEKFKVFFNNTAVLNGAFVFANKSNSKRLFKKEKYPSIKLKNIEYIFIDGTWYSKGTENQLLETSMNCKS